MITDDTASPSSGTVRKQRMMKDGPSMNQLLLYRWDNANQQRTVACMRRSCLQLKRFRRSVSQARRSVLITSEGAAFQQSPTS